MKRKTIIFDFTNDRGNTLSGRLELPKDGDPVAYGVFANCFTCMKEFFAPTRVCRGLAERGIAMLRFDFTGLGESEGSFTDGNFGTNISDILSASSALEKGFGQSPMLLIGHSLGGAAALAASAELPSLKAVATIGSPKDPNHVLRHFQDQDQLIEHDDVIELKVADRTYLLKKQFLDNLSAHDVAQNTADFGGASFVFQAPKDDMVKAINAQEIYDRAVEPKFLHMMGDDVGHMLDRPQDTEYVAETLSVWLKGQL